MTDKVKQSAHFIKREAGLSYMTARSLVVGDIILTAQSDSCLVAKALEVAPRWADPKPGAKVTACRCLACLKAIEADGSGGPT